MREIKPYSPEDAARAKGSYLPPEIIEAFNEMLALDYCDGRATVMQDAVVDLIVAKMAVSQSGDAEE